MIRNNPKFVFRYMFDWLANPARLRARTSLPTILNFPVTDNCNSRCIMCDVWKTKSSGELSAAMYGKILADPLFGNIKHVGISGGEPTLRMDLVAIVQVVVESIKGIKSISITSHGFHVARWVKFLPLIQDICSISGVRFTLNLSLDGIGELHDEVRKVSGGYDRVIRTYNLARQLGIPVNFQTTVSRANVFGVVHVLKTAQKFDADVDFRVATTINRLDNQISMRTNELEENERSFFSDFLVSPSLLNGTRSPARRLFYRDLSSRLVTQNHRHAPCFYKREGVLLTPHGDLYHCSISTHKLGNAMERSSYELYFLPENEQMREMLIRNACPGCLHDQSGAWRPIELIAEVLRSIKGLGKINKFFNVGVLFFKSLPSIFRIIGLSLRKASGREIEKIDSALVLGMYGGEHVGDAAILGGVIQRMVHQYNVQQVYVASFRPDRTKRWVSSLVLPAKTAVVHLDEANLVLDRSNGVILAGGPVMDLTEILLRQLTLVGRALSQGKPFIIDGVGIGPIRKTLNQFLARLLFMSASQITLRSHRSRSHSVVRRLKVNLSDDPAFDYISSRTVLDQIPEFQAEQLIRLIPTNPDLIKVGINLRPLWDKYIFSTRHDAPQPVFLSVLSMALQALRVRLDGKVSFYFYPMNADQFGFSDLNAAYDLMRHLPAGFPFQIWESEPGVDGVISFVRRMDVIIAMRFHAAIFALSQGVPVLGVDYSIGKPGKVTDLFIERGLDSRVCRVDTFSSAWMVERMIEIIKETKHTVK